MEHSLQQRVAQVEGVKLQVFSLVADKLDDGPMPVRRSLQKAPMKHQRVNPRKNTNCSFKITTTPLLGARTRPKDCL